MELIELYTFIFSISCLVTTIHANAPFWTPSFPSFKRDNQTFTFQSAISKSNVTLNDPYFWLENSSDPDVEAFINDQMKLTESYMKNCKNANLFNETLQNANDYDVLDNVQRWGEGNEIFYLFSFQFSKDPFKVWYKATIEQFQIAMKDGFLFPPGKVYFNESLLNLNDSSEIDIVTVSPDGKIFSYLVIDSNNKLTTYFRSIDNPLTNIDNKDQFQPGGSGSFSYFIQNSWNSIYWTKDSKGFFYYDHSYNKSEGTIKLRYHLWGDKYENDITIFDVKDVIADKQFDHYLNIALSPNDDWLIVMVDVDASYDSKAYATKLKDQQISSKMKWICLNDDYDYQFFPITIINDYFYFQTNQNNSFNSKIAKVYLNNSNATTIKTYYNELSGQVELINVIPERDDAMIVMSGGFAIGKDKVILVYYENGQNTVYLYDLLTGEKIERILQDEVLSFYKVQNKYITNFIQISFTTWNCPLKYYEFELVDSGELKVSIIKITTIKGTSLNDYQLQEFYAISKDGTKVPYFVTSKKGTPSNSPVWQHVYASYGIVESLFYFPPFFAWLNTFEGFFVWTSARGGGDLGDHWHELAVGHKKQNTFDDVIAVSEDLIKRKITSDGKIIIEGAYEGGTAVAVVINQARKNLFGASILARPICDVIGYELRSDLRDSQIYEVGNVSAPVDFDFIRSWTPYNNVDPKKPYPTIFVSTSNDQVVPIYQGMKCLAQYQFYHPKNPNPLLLYDADYFDNVDSNKETPSLYDEPIYQFCITSLALGLEVRK